MIKNSKEFWFNGHSSKEFGVDNVNINNSILEEPFLAGRNIMEEKTRWNPKSYFNNAEEQCKEFQLNIAFKPEYCGGTQMMNKRALRNIGLWLGRTDKYSDMWFIEDCAINPHTKKRDITRPRRIYFAMLTGNSTINHYGRDMGYLTLTFKTNSPYCYSKLKGGDVYSVQASSIQTSEDDEDLNNYINFFSRADKPIKPEISLKNIKANQKIKFIGEKITNVTDMPLNEFDYTFDLDETDYRDFPVFEISDGKQAKGNFELLDTVYDGETITIGEKTYEFDLGDNRPRNKLDKDNILVPINGGRKASNTLKFKDGFITDGNTVTIGDQCFEYDFNGIVTPTNIKVDVSEYVGRASGILNLNSNLLPNQEMTIGDVNYTMVGGTNEFIIKMTDHLLTNGDDVNLKVRTNRRTLTQDNVNINTRIPKDINKCLVRNVTKNPSDLGIRKMKYLDKDFVMVLWDGESDQDYHKELTNININSRITIGFDREVDENTVNENTIVVTNMEGNKIPILFDVESAGEVRTVGIRPVEPYKPNMTYYIYVGRGVKDISGKGFKYARKIKFVTNESSKKSNISRSMKALNPDDIQVHVDGNYQLGTTCLKDGELPKAIKGMRANDDIWLYEQNTLDCVVDDNMLIPIKVPEDAKAYAAKTNTISKDGTKDDFHNAIEILKPLGYEIVDIAKMPLEDKKKIEFNEGDLVIGGELAGALVNDFDAQGNLKITPPQVDNPNDIRGERVAGIPRDIYIKPARRLCGSSSDPGRLGTKKAMEDWATLINQAKSDDAILPEGYTTNLNLSGITVKYKVPNEARIYGTGTDFYNGLRYLGDMGYNFLNVGSMNIEEKTKFPYKKGDLVLGGTGAKDVVLENGEKVTVQGIPMIDIGKAIRLGGKDRYETEKKIKDYAVSLKSQSIEVGDILKLKIIIGNENDEKINKDGVSEGDDPALLSDKERIKKNTRIEYHRVKNIKALSRNRLFIEFEEDIRTIYYIKSIDIEEVYKLYDERKAEDYLFTAPYQIKIGYHKDETMINIIKAINDTGTSGKEYSLRTFKHPIVLGQKKNNNEILISAIEMGSKGNIPVSLVDTFDKENRFLTPTLTGGKDCSQDNAIIALAETIEKQNKLPERYNKDRYECDYTSNELTVTHVLRGKKYNDIICLSNITKRETAPYFIEEGNTHLVNLNDFLTREKQIAKWKDPTLTGGEDPDKEMCVIALKNKIEKVQKDDIEVKFFITVDSEIKNNKLLFTYRKIGEIGNVNFDTTCVYGRISGKKFTDGIDGLEEGEELYFNCERQEIVSSLNKDRYKNFNGGWLEVPLDGVRWRIVEGQCVVRFRYREAYNI